MYTNRLADEKSPYLLQHAHNPVDWYPWGEEAFAKARAEDKPIFLSIGYSTCHWCHVMERESFENDAIAALLNEHFVSHQSGPRRAPRRRPHLHGCVQATTGSGGWPMSVWLTPDLKPFYGRHLFPARHRYGGPGFRRSWSILPTPGTPSARRSSSPAAEHCRAVAQNLRGAGLGLGFGCPRSGF